MNDMEGYGEGGDGGYIVVGAVTSPKRWDVQIQHKLLSFLVLLSPVPK